LCWSVVCGCSFSEHPSLLVLAGGFFVVCRLDGLGECGQRGVCALLEVVGRRFCAVEEEDGLLHLVEVSCGWCRCRRCANLTAGTSGS